MRYGRARELEAVNRLLAATLAGQRTLIIDGAADIGKTRLVADAVSMAHSGGFTTLTGAAEPSDRGRPFGAISHVLGSAGGSSEVARLLDELERVRRGARWLDPMLDVGFRITDAITEQVEQGRGSRPAGDRAR